MSEKTCGLCAGVGEVEVTRADTIEQDYAGCPECMAREHAERVEALEAEVARLREELEKYASYTDRHGCLTGDCPHLNANECVKAVGATLVNVMKDAEDGWGHAAKLAEALRQVKMYRTHANWAGTMDDASAALAAYDAAAKEL